MPPLRIGVNALYLIPGGVGGTEIYLRSLLRALSEIDPNNRYFLFTNRETGADLTPHAANFSSEVQPVHAASRPRRLLWEQAWLPRLAESLDVMFNPGFTAPLGAACPQVTVFHDLQHKRHREFFRWFDRPAWDFLLYWSVKVSKRLIAVSEATAADLVRYYRVPQQKVAVVPHGVDPEFHAIAARRSPEPFLLSVSTLHPHKNLDNLLRAFAEFRRTKPQFRLVICGLHGFVAGPLHELRDALGLRDAVDFPGWIPRAELYDLFRRAWAFFYPSRFEGFGMPVIEALAAGVPTACSAIEPLRSLAGGAALLFDPLDGKAILEAMVRLTSEESERARLAAAGPARAADFSWPEAARQTLDILYQAAGPSRVSG